MSSVIVACGGKSAFELAVGDCFDDPTSFEEVSEVPEKACSEAHDNEVFANRDMPDSTWPGDVAVQDWADEACLEEFEPYVGASYDASSLEFGWLVPTEASWNEIGDRTVTCILYDTAFEKLTGSVKGTGV
jgi:hypothetical protein